MTDDVFHYRHLTVSQRLRDRRHDLGLTQKQVVQRLIALGMHTTNKTLSCHENGSGLDVAKLPALARALDCTTTYLLGLTDDPCRWEPDGVQTRRAGGPLVNGADGAPARHQAVTERRRTADEQPRRQGDRATWILGPGVPEAPPRRASTSLPRRG